MERRDRADGTPFLALGVLAICCGGHLLALAVAAGLLGALAGWLLAVPAVLLGAAALGAGAGLFLVRRRARSARADACCQPDIQSSTVPAER